MIWNLAAIAGAAIMGLLPDTLHCGLRMRRESRERFPPTRVSDTDMHHGTCVTHVPMHARVAN